MLKQAAFIALIFAMYGCGGNTGKLPGSSQRSQVTPLFKPISLNESHGDGKLASFTVKLPLSETSIDSVSSPVDPRGGVSRVPIVGDVLRLVGQAAMSFAVRWGAADQDIIISQPIPEIDTDIVKHVSVKRVFFQIKETSPNGEVIPPKPPRRNLVERIWNGGRNIIRGNSRISFGFIEQLKINMRMAQSPTEVTSWIPDVIFSDDTTGRYVLERNMAQADRFPPFTLLNYDRDKRDKLVNDVGPIITFYSEKPVDLQRVFRRIEAFKPLMKDITKVGKSVIIELNSEPTAAVTFKRLMRTHERDFAEVKYVEVDCTEGTCMDVAVDQRNLLPMLMRGNTLKIDTDVKLYKVPATSFQLRGYIEFEIKIDSPL